MSNVAIIGRPNVGKSTLFNRLIGRKGAFVDKIAGITRDRNYGRVEDGRFSFDLIDTGGMSFEKTDIQELIKRQVDFAIKEAGLILFLIDGKEGILPSDIKILNSLRKREKDFLLVVNKMDKRPYKEEEMAHFYKISPSFIPISSSHGINMPKLLDEIRKRLKKEEKDEEKHGIPIAIIGRPNVGKSSILNAIVRKERAIVSSIPGTTRDPVVEGFVFKEKEFTLVDTAGIRKKIETKIEAGYVASAIRNIKNADIVWLIIDAGEGIVAQEKRLIERIEGFFIPYIIVVNKFDIVNMNKMDYKRRILESLPFLDKANILIASAITGLGIKTLLNETHSLSESLNIPIKTSILNKVIARFSTSPRFPKIYYATQTASKPPTFTLFVNNPMLSNEDWLKRIKKALRKGLDISVPIKILLKKS